MLLWSIGTLDPETSRRSEILKYYLINNHLIKDILHTIIDVRRHEAAMHRYIETTAYYILALIDETLIRLSLKTGSIP